MRDIRRFLKENRIIAVIILGLLMIFSLYLNSSVKFMKIIIFILWFTLLLLDFELEYNIIKKISQSIKNKLYIAEFIIFLLVLMVNCIL